MSSDTPSPRVDYDRHGTTYARHRRADVRIARRVHHALGDARTVLNVGAGAGSYEPADRWVLAVEPSATMRAQRPHGAAPVLIAHAEALPFDEDSVDAVMACMTVHHWTPDIGLAELRRVARGPVVVLTFDLDAVVDWQQHHLAPLLELERPRFGPVERVAEALGGRTRIERVPTPADCTDGFFEAFWNRPEALLDPAVRSAQSAWALLAPGIEDQVVKHLAADLRTGAWDRKHGDLRERDELDGSLRLIVSEP